MGYLLCITRRQKLAATGETIVMTTNASSKNPPASFFQSFVDYDAKGGLDIRKSVKAFEAAFTDWVKEQGEIKPAILSELQEHPRLGEGDLQMFVMHRLHMKPGKEAKDRIQQALVELTKSGKIVYHTTESGQRRGRGAGYILASNATVADKEKAA